MNTHRLKKDLQHKDGRSTIIERHSLKMQEFAPIRQAIEAKEILLRKTEEKLAVTTCKESILVLRKELDAITKELEVLGNDNNEVDYLLKASPYLCPQFPKKTLESRPSESCKGLGKFLEKTGSINKGSTYTKYMEDCHSVYYCDNTLEDNGNTTGDIHCVDCNIPMYYEQKEANLVCCECGNTVQFQDNATTGEFRDDVQILSPFAYKRMTHLKEYLSQIQAKETTDIPNDIINLIKREIKKERITDPNEITPRRVRGYLKKLRMNKYYDHVNSIIVIITGTSALKLSSELECTFIEMFQEIQAPFEKHCPPERKNFLSYSYTLHKMCLILGQDRLCEYFPLLKSRNKNYAQDCIWKKICEQIGWPFHPSV